MKFIFDENSKAIFGAWKLSCILRITISPIVYIFTQELFSKLDSTKDVVISIWSRHNTSSPFI